MHVFSYEFCEILRTPSYIEHFWWLLLISQYHDAGKLRSRIIRIRGIHTLTAETIKIAKHFRKVFHYICFIGS